MTDFLFDFERSEKVNDFLKSSPDRKSLIIIDELLPNYDSPIINEWIHHKGQSLTLVIVAQTIPFSIDDFDVCLICELTHNLVTSSEDLWFKTLKSQEVPYAFAIKIKPNQIGWCYAQGSSSPQHQSEDPCPCPCQCRIPNDFEITKDEQKVTEIDQIKKLTEHVSRIINELVEIRNQLKQLMHPK